jgi:hypothetical protein
MTNNSPETEIYVPQVRAKRIYTLAYQRASAVLRKRHAEEFARLVEVHKNNIRAEEMLTGSIEREPRGGQLLHLEDEKTAGVCEYCGGAWPCRAAKRREQERLKPR